MAARRAVERLALVVCRWAHEADAMMKSSVAQVRERVDLLGVVRKCVRAWRFQVGRFGVGKVAGLRALCCGWAEAMWAAEEVLSPEAGRRCVEYGPIRVSPWSAGQLRRIYLCCTFV